MNKQANNQSHDLRDVLREQWGFEEFRPGQERVIRTLLEGRDVLSVLPTGAGKSLTYQMTALLLPGVTVVVSPLLALMKDQVVALEARGISVTVINSAQSERERAKEMDEAQRGESKLVYVTPERFANKECMDQLRQLDVSLFVVDEAHAVSEWGHSFRPAYLNLKDAIKKLGRPPVLALTATATPWIRRDIIECLGLRDPRVMVHGIDRPNLFFEVRRVENEYDDRAVLEQLMSGKDESYPSAIAEQLNMAMGGSGIIYVATTKAARETAEWLQASGIAADYYHGQRRKADRVRVQEAFMSGELQVIVATNAFGLGIDKPDVRFVIHRDVPGSLEAYYQEAGRAGRDGEFARCVIIYRPADLGRAAFLGGTGQLTREEFVQASAALVAHPQTNSTELQEATGLSKQDYRTFLKVLQDERIIEVKRERIRLLQPDFDPLAVSLDGEERRKAYEASRLEMMRSYAEAADCRRRYILGYFGETGEQDGCRWCDNHVPRSNGAVVVAAHIEIVQSSFAPGDPVVHEQWGAGVVERVDADTLTVMFETVGHRSLALDVVQENDLLRAA